MFSGLADRLVQVSTRHSAQHVSSQIFGKECEIAKFVSNPELWHSTSVVTGYILPERKPMPSSGYETLRDQFPLILSGAPWYGHPVMTILTKVDAATANHRVIPGAHTIWEILNHMTVWTDIIRSRVTTGTDYSPSPEEDWPPTLDSSTHAWNASVRTFENAWSLLARHIETLSDKQMEMNAPTTNSTAGQYTVAELLHGIIQHTVYHSAQIALLAKFHEKGPA